MEIIPAVLPSDFEELQSTLEQLRDIAPYVQIDVVDGVFAPNRTWPYSDQGSFACIVEGEEGLPLWDVFEFEVDIMATRAQKSALEWVEAGASRIIIHGESTDAPQTVEALQEKRGGELGVEVGIALSIQTPLSALEAFAGRYDYVQLMGIARVGFQGEKLDERIFERIRALRAMLPGGTIQIDGGVKESNAAALRDAGASRLVAGSALLGAPDIRAAYRALSLL